MGPASTGPSTRALLLYRARHIAARTLVVLARRVEGDGQTVWTCRGCRPNRAWGEGGISRGRVHPIQGGNEGEQLS
jgi:hypothetical protein